ncbi:cryptochrome/photolyase family protein [Neisseria montereyensis]|uniref:DNA photolyase family protein n=1 Tax=Neisseria montereyensis TaxID=2973938 RepID=A0ABT2FDQ0_9NEIS|nr:deoxyribodipyrimidine photo-lyase [Neisseria montereyensis]MCS4534296.1 DNA photolyase family protein [Neisseria montereyensis]
MQPITLIWFRRDLRLFDNTALQTAIRQGLPVVGVFIFDNDADPLLHTNHRRASFIYDSVQAFQTALNEKNIPLYILHGAAEQEIPKLAAQLHATAVICAEDYEPQSTARDNTIWRRLDEAGRTLIRVDDQVLLPKAAVMTHTGRPYSVFTPYKKAWLQTYTQYFGHWQPADDWAALSALQTKLPEAARRTPTLPSPETIGFTHQNTLFPGGEAEAQKQLGRFLEHVDTYHISRDFPAQKGTSRLSPYLSHGLLSPRHLVYLAKQADSEGANVWLSELIWREFFKQVLFHHPETAYQSFRPEYRAIQWPNNPEWFERWKAGQTGFPIVDAAMRQLSGTGWMHNRLRMITASFLVKDLLTDWRLGEAWFAEQLIDYDLSANNGGWQWSAGTGCDAQPYFRIFNPVLQSQKFDPDGQFIRRHIPELAHLGKDIIHAPWLAKESIDTHGYPYPIVNHAEQRELVKALFQQNQAV